MDVSSYADNFQISFLFMNVMAGFYFVLVRSISWSGFHETQIMERQGTVLVYFCLFISVINFLESDTDLWVWMMIVVCEFLVGALVGLAADKMKLTNWS